MGCSRGNAVEVGRVVPVGLYGGGGGARAGENFGGGPCWRGSGEGRANLLVCFSGWPRGGGVTVAPLLAAEVSAEVSGVLSPLSLSD